MERIAWLRKTERLHNLRPIGVNGAQVRSFAAEVALVGHEAELFALPYWGGLAGEDQALQFADGTPAFMWGVSAMGDPREPHGP